MQYAAYRAACQLYLSAHEKKWGRGKSTDGIKSLLKSWLCYFAYSVASVFFSEPPVLVVSRSLPGKQSVFPRGRLFPHTLCPLPTSLLRCMDYSLVLIHLIPVTPLNSFILGLKSSCMRNLFGTTDPPPAPFLRLLYRSCKSSCTPWCDFIRFSMLDCELPEGWSSSLSSARGFDMVPDKCLLDESIIFRLELSLYLKSRPIRPSAIR